MTKPCITQHFFSLGLLATMLGTTLGIQVRGQDPKDSPTIRVIENIPYIQGDGAHPTKHRLDLYLPANKTCFPVLFFVHGGAWIQGDKNFLGIYSAVGKAFAKQGVATVLINYRLSPEVRHPDHARDVAKAFKWTCDHIAEYGGDTERITLCGHSAGGHLVSLLACNQDLQKEVDINPAKIQAVVSLSGVHKIRKGFLPPIFPVDKFDLNPSPLDLVNKGLPPFLLVYATGDLPTCGKSACKEFADELKKNEVPHSCLEMAGSHATTLWRAGQTGSPLMKAILKVAHDPQSLSASAP